MTGILKQFIANATLFGIAELQQSQVQIEALSFLPCRLPRAVKPRLTEDGSVAPLAMVRVLPKTDHTGSTPSNSLYYNRVMLGPMCIYSNRSSNSLEEGHSRAYVYVHCTCYNDSPALTAWGQYSTSKRSSQALRCSSLSTFPVKWHVVGVPPTACSCFTF